MRLAIVHNLGGGGAKRALYEQALRLQARGHALDLYVPATADETYLPLGSLCERVKVYGECVSPPAGGGGGSTGRRLFRRLFGSVAHDLVRDTVWTRRRELAADRMERLYEQIAADIDRGEYDLVYVHQCEVLLAPVPLFRGVRTAPTVFYCQDTLRRAFEWTIETTPEYDATPPPWPLRRRLGRVVTPLLAAWSDREAKRYINGVRAATRVLCNSLYSREAILRTTGVEPRVCYLGVDGDFFTPDPAIPREREVLSVGALRAEKRHDRVLDAVAWIPAERRPTLRIAGYAMGPDGHDFAECLQRAASKKGVTLRMDAGVTDDRLRDAYRRCAVVAFAPYLEPFGLVALEAMACGTPVVGVAEGGLRESIQDGITGLLTGSDPAEIAAALDAVLSDPALAARLGKQGRESVCERWTWERSVDRLEMLFGDALAGRVAAG
jgi:glycosyltransferase involved in cell wall biosynthesis